MNRITLLSLALVALTVACSGGSNSAGTPTQPQAQVGTVQGTVKDDTGAPVSGASLSLTATGQSTLSSSSAADGTFSFTQVRVGAWTLTAAAPAGFTANAQSTAAVNVAAGQTASVNLLLTKGSAPQSGNVPVSIADFSFTPGSVTITVGSTITWKNNGPSSHTTTSDGAEWDSGTLANGSSFSHTFNTKGTFTYHCTIHPTMKGTIVVQ